MSAAPSAEPSRATGRSSSSSIPQSGVCRRVEGFVAQVLQRRRNHETVELVRVSVEIRPDLAERFKIETVPTICVVEEQRLRKRITAPRGCRELERELGPWLN